MARRPRATLLGAVLALLAMVVLVAVSGWHSATIHEHGSVQVAAVGQDRDHDHMFASDHDDDHAPSKQGDGDGSAHLLAHAAGHWVAFDGPTTAPVPTIVAARAWLMPTVSLLGEIEPSKLLRPPRG